MTTAHLMLDMGEILGPEAALQLRWQQRARQHPHLLESVLAEVKMLTQEGRIRTSPAAAAEDYWKRIAPEHDGAVVEKSG